MALFTGWISESRLSVERVITQAAEVRKLGLPRNASAHSGFIIGVCSLHSTLPGGS